MKNLVKRSLSRFGIVVQRANLYSRPDRRLVHFLSIHGIDTVLDVGANRGQFALELIDAGYEGLIVSFEALPNAYEELKKRAHFHGDSWLVAPRFAIGETAGKVRFYVTRGDASSSILKPNDEANSAPEHFSVMEEMEVECERLDTLVESLGISSDRIFLKVDVQGFEPQVLAGAERLYQRIQGMGLEMVLSQYYDGQMLARELDNRVTSMGFELWDIVPVWRQKSTGRLDHFDGVYFRFAGEVRDATQIANHHYRTNELKN